MNNENKTIFLIYQLVHLEWIRCVSLFAIADVVLYGHWAILS